MTTDFRAEEEWKPVVGYEGLYSVSSLGNVRSEERVVSNGTASRIVKPRLLRQRKNPGGYWCVYLCKKCKRETFRVHRIVALAFLGEPPAGCIVLHGCRGKDCNSIDNLSYGTSSQNNGKDRLRDGTDNRGARNGNAKLKDDDIRFIRKSSDTHAALAKAYGVSQTTIYQIRLNTRWSHVR